MRRGTSTSRCIWTAAPAMLLAACGPDPGFQAVKDWCARDGGEHIYDTVYVGGFLANENSAQCLACRGDLPKMAFEFIDVFVKRVDPVINEPGHYRFSLSTVDDPKCHPLADDGEFFWTKRSWELPADRCLVIERLTEGASTLTWERRGEPVPINEDLTIFRTEYVFIDRATDRILASHRDYAYTSKFTKVFETALSGSSNPDATCNDPGYQHLDQLLQRVFRDPAKREER